MPQPDSSASPSAPKVALSSITSPTISYASYQNSVPAIHQIQFENCTNDDLTGIEIKVSAEPSFFDPLTFRLERLAPGSITKISPIDLRIHHKLLTDLDESVRGHLAIDVTASGGYSDSRQYPIEILAYDQWGGTRGIPELLAAFSTPNNPFVDRVLSEAAGLLASKGQALTGYQSKNRDDVWSQISAIYSAVAKLGVSYSVPPASFVTDGQKIRTPDRIITGGVATCIDFVMLICSCLEQAGLNPVILLEDGHAWLACWLINTSFGNPVTDDPQNVRKRIDAGELIAFETTCLGQKPVISLRLACESGVKRLRDESQKFRMAIDIARSRIERIQPLPSRGVASLEQREIANASELGVEPAPALPSLAGETVLLDENEHPETPAGRLSRWKSKLLDLTRRNRLLNFKATKVMVPLKVPDPAHLEDALTNGHTWRLRPMPKIMEGADPRSQDLALFRTGENPLDQMAKQAFGQRELLATVDKDKLDSQLYEIYLTVKNNLEEGGANTLYLAIGFLKWTEDDRAEQVNAAPILLVPVTLNRASVRTGFSIERHDDETMANPTLVQMLKERFGVELKGLDPLPQDESGIDVEKILAIFRQAVKEIPRWEVTTDVYLGVFSFTKYLMWKDLNDRSEDLRKNRVVGHLIDRPREPLATKGDIQERGDLDDRHPAGSLLTPLLADSSQLNAISRAAEGHDIVIEGPPGTGKSQTITNLIAHFLGQGKKVLFISEKMAALGVVERRLNQIGLGPFCLQLHSAKAKKTEVLAQLKTSLQIGQKGRHGNWELEAEKINRLRGELNGFVRALHKTHPNGLTVRDAIDSAILHRSWPQVPVESKSIDSLDLRGLEALRDLAGALEASFSDLEARDFESLQDILRPDWSNAWEQQLADSISEFHLAIEDLNKSARELSTPLGLQLDAASWTLLEDVERLADCLLNSCEVPKSFSRVADDSSARSKLNEVRVHGEKRNTLWGQLSAQFQASIANADGGKLLNEWSAASLQWFLPRWMAHRRISKELALHTVSHASPDANSIPHILSTLRDLNTEDRVLRDQESAAKELLADSYAGIDTNWAAVERFEQWGRTLESVLSRFESLEQPAQRRALAAKVRTLTTEQRSLLTPSGAVALSLVRYKECIHKFRTRLKAIHDLIGKASLARAEADKAGYLAQCNATAAGWMERRASLASWCRWVGLRNQANAAGLRKIVDKVIEKAVPGNQFADFVEYAYRVWWLKGIIDREPLLRTFSRSDHERKILEFRAADERFQKLTEKYLFAKLAAGLPNTDTPTPRNSEMGVLNREIAKQRAHYPVRKLVQCIPTLLPQLKPCLLMSPLSVAQYLDAGHTMFDIVIFDEASQIPVWDAVGAIARGSQVIVVGDPKQLPPTSFFERADEDDDLSVDSENLAIVKDLESILDESMATGMSQLTLDWHYRSKHESLIAFSNGRYYDSRLITFPSPVTTDLAVKLNLVHGVYDRGGSRTNRAEADAIVQRIVNHFEDPASRDQTIGVVTFNQPQMRLVDQLLQAELLKNPSLEDRIAAHGDERLFIKNLENVQGDERDIILFSITYGKDQAGRMAMNFGPINQDGGHRRLNVAVTRARNGVEIFSSVRAEDIDMSRTRARGVADLKAYLDYATRGARAIAEESSPTGREPDSPFEVDIIQHLRNAGYTVHPQVGCSGYRIDIGIVDNSKPGRYLAGVECDGATYHGLPVARDRDRLRQAVLTGLGWKLLRVWSTDWWQNREKTGAELLKSVAALQAEAEKSNPPS